VQSGKSDVNESMILRERDGRTTVRRLRHSIRVLDILCALIVPAACDTINSYGAQTFKEPTT